MKPYVNSDTVSLYEVLEVSPRASQAVIKAAFRCLAQLNHPDKHPHSPTAVERQARLNAAYAVLSEPHTRQRYDQRVGLQKPAFVERRNGDHAIGTHSPSKGNNQPENESTGPHEGIRAFAFRPLV